jgi:hypothetical protein
MTKKSRRIRRKGSRPRLSEAQLVRPTETAIQEASTEGEIGPIESAAPSKTKDFREEYQYVADDLKRIGILAAAMLGGLVILSFVL